jgi:N-acetyl-anhydromuramyl-L-alanine amidase AmpD
MNGKLQQDITQFLNTFDMHGPELEEKDWEGNVDFHLLKQARELLVRAVNEPDRNWYIRELAEYQASMCNNAEKDGIVIQHFQGAYNDYSDNQLKRTYEAQKAVFKSESN